MDLLIVLTYVALAWAIFKIFRIPVNQWTLSTAALGGIFQPPLYLYGAEGGDLYSHHAAGYWRCERGDGQIKSAD